MNLRIGNGIDFHKIEKLDEEGLMVLGGTTIRSYYKIIAHSDGDIVLHALSDAILGACGEADIGYFFPDTDPKKQKPRFQSHIKQSLRNYEKQKLLYFKH
jgi:2-C-methyl-D-erythritol 2,4-cyclodiphosphate synthase